MNIHPIQIMINDKGNKSSCRVDFNTTSEFQLKIQELAVKLILDITRTIKNNRLTYSIQICQLNLGIPVYISFFTSDRSNEINNAQLVGSQILKFKTKEESDLLKIVEIDERGSPYKTIWWVDYTSFFEFYSIQDKTSECIRVWNYKPRDLSEKEVKEKYQTLIKDYPKFEFGFVYYNQHGIFTWAFDENMNYVLFYAKPDEERLQPLQKDNFLEFSIKQGYPKIYSKDGFLVFTDEQLNNEPIKRINLNQLK